MSTIGLRRNRRDGQLESTVLPVWATRFDPAVSEAEQLAMSGTQPNAEHPDPSTRTRQSLRDIIAGRGSGSPALDNRVVALFGERWASLHARSNPPSDREPETSALEMTAASSDVGESTSGILDQLDQLRTSIDLTIDRNRESSFRRIGDSVERFRVGVAGLPPPPPAPAVPLVSYCLFARIGVCIAWTATDTHKRETLCDGA